MQENLGIFDTIIDQLSQFGVRHIGDASKLGLEIIIPKEASTSTEWTNYARSQMQNAGGRYDYMSSSIKIFGMPITWSNVLKEVHVRRDLKKLILPKAPAAAMKQTCNIKSRSNNV